MKFFDGIHCCFRTISKVIHNTGCDHASDIVRLQLATPINARALMGYPEETDSSNSEMYQVMI